MAKTQKPNEEEIVKGNIQKRFKTMFSGENQPLSNMSLQEAEALKTRVADLEALLAKQQVPLSDYKPAAQPAESSIQSTARQPRAQTARQQEPIVSAALEKRIGLWVTGIWAVAGLAFFGVDLYMVFGLQGGVWDLSDKVLMPFTVLMFVASLVGWNLVRRDRITPGVWTPYLINVILGPVLVVLVLKNFHILMGGYLVLFSLLFIALILPKTSRVWAILAAVGAALAIAGIEVWNPAFRLDTSHIQNFTYMILGPAAVAILALFFITYRLRNSGIQARLTVLLMTVMIPLLIVVSAIVTSLARARIEAGANTELQGNSRSFATNISTWLELNRSALHELTLQPDIVNMNAAEQRPVLQAMAKAHPYMYLVSTTDLAGFNVARNDDGDLTDYSDRDWFKGPSTGSSVTYQSLIGRTSKQPALVISMPIKNESGTIIGVGMFAADLTDLAKETRITTIGERGYTYLVDTKNQTLAHPDPAVTAELRDMSEYPPVVALRHGNMGPITFTDENGERWRAYANVLDNGWAIIAQRPEDEILAPARQFQILIILLMMAGTGVMLASVWFTIRRTLQPIYILTETVSAIAAGDLNRVVEIDSRDEIGTLAHTFNDMTSQIRNLVGGLEQRVADRTHDLELAAEVGRTVTERVTNLYEMLTEAAKVIRARFNLYYTQIYLTGPAGEKIILRAGTGDVGKELLRRGHNLVVNSSSLNGRAVLEKRAQIVADTKESPNFLPNVLLPNTRSEMSIPLVVDEKVVGVLDMQSEHPGALSEINLPAFEVLAGQLAVAIRNAALFVEVQEARAEVEAQMSRFTAQGWQDFLNAIDKGHRIGYAFADSTVVPLPPDVLLTKSNADWLNLPITVTGTKVGEIQLPANLKSTDLELVQSVSEQLAQHVENLRLLAQAEMFRKEAEQAVRRLTREGWDTHLNSANQPEMGFVYDLNQVQPLSQNNRSNVDHSFRQPLVVRDETIGELQLDLPETSEEVIEIISMVAQQLSGHLENLRLFEQTERALIQTEGLSQQNQLILDSAGEGIFGLDEQGNHTFVNPAAAQMLGYSIEELIGCHSHSTWHHSRPDGSHYPAEECPIYASLHEGKIHRGEEFFWRKDGRGFLVDFTSTPVQEGGRTIGAVVTFRDITERVHAQKAIAKRAAELQTVAEVSTTAATTLEPDRLLQAVVDLTKEQFGLYHAHIYIADESWNTLLLAAGAGEVGRKLVAEGHAIPMSLEQSLVARAARERKALIVNDVSSEPGFLPNPLLPETCAEMAVPMIVGDKLLGVFDVQSTSTAGFSEEDANIYITLAAQVGVALQNARLYVEQAATVTQLRELDRLKSSFLANMSHELRTPLNSILGFADVIIEELDGPLTDNMSSDLRLIQKNGQHLLHLINDVLDMAKIEAGRMNLNPEHFTACEVLEEVTSITSTLASEKNLALFIDQASDQGVKIYADRTRLRQVMINLVNNAIKFTETGNISLKLVTLDSVRVLFTVKDTGIGIPPDKLEAVFQEFTQVDSSSTRKAGGTGLGLPISRKLVEMHGGRLWAESTGIPGEGSTFFVELPIEARITETIEKQA